MFSFSKGQKPYFTDLDNNPIPSQFGGIVEYTDLEELKALVSEASDCVDEGQPTSELIAEVKTKVDQLQIGVKKAIEFYNFLNNYRENILFSDAEE